LTCIPFDAARHLPLISIFKSSQEEDIELKTHKKVNGVCGVDYQDPLEYLKNITGD